MTAFVRTLLGDLPADEALGVCAAHEHIVIRGAWLETHFPEFVLDDLGRAVTELRDFRTSGGGWLVDSMPTAAGRDAALLAQASRLSETPIVCSTGVHQAKYYPSGHPLLTHTRDELAKLFHHEIVVGINDGEEQLPLRAGIIKAASNGPELSNRDREVFAAAALVQHQIGCPILTHTHADRDAHQQIAWLADHGANLSHVVLSHCDKNHDAHYHRDLLQTGVCLEFDQHFRQVLRGEPCATIDLIAKLIMDFPHQLLVGMDLARSRYWKAYGGSPGLAWLVTELVDRLRAAGLPEAGIHRLLAANPVQAYSFRS